MKPFVKCLFGIVVGEAVPESYAKQDLKFTTGYNEFAMRFMFAVSFSVQHTVFCRVPDITTTEHQICPG